MRTNTLVRWTGTLMLAAFVASAWVIVPAAQEPHADPGLAGDAEVNPFTTRFDRRVGERHFLRQCSRCHGQDATGNDETGAPDLTTGRFSNASSSKGIFDVIRNGVDGTAMIPIVPSTTDEEIWQLVTYVESLSTSPMDIDLPGNTSAGLQVFNGKGDCASCHMVNGEGSRLGPDLSRVGERRDPSELRSDLLIGRRGLSHGRRHVHATRDGRERRPLDVFQA